MKQRTILRAGVEGYLVAHAGFFDSTEAGISCN